METTGLEELTSVLSGVEFYLVVGVIYYVLFTGFFYYFFALIKNYLVEINESLKTISKNFHEKTAKQEDPE